MKNSLEERAREFWDKVWGMPAAEHEGEFAEFLAFARSERKRQRGRDAEIASASIGFTRHEIAHAILVDEAED